MAEETANAAPEAGDPAAVSLALAGASRGEADACLDLTALEKSELDQSLRMIAA